jgi:hypothetical protein
MKLIISFVVALFVLASWDAVAYNGKYRQAVERMGGQMATAFHVR